MRNLYLVTVCWFVAFSVQAQTYDLVIKGGRVMDPQTQLDAVRHVAISNGTIQRVTRETITGRTEIDASGLVVAPGFIDLHAHGQDLRSNTFQAADGVTTALELEIGVLPVGTWLESRKGRALLNYGATASHMGARIYATTGIDVGNPIYLTDEVRNAAGRTYSDQPLDEAQQSAMLRALRAGVEEGALGIGIGVTYTPAASHAEIFSVFQLAADLGVPVFVHIRQARYMGGDLLAPLQEVLANAAATGAALHVVHLNSSLDEQAREAMVMIRGARQRGVDVTTESYPYTAGSTRIESALFDDYTGDFSQLQWTVTGERLTRESFEDYRRQGGWVIIHGRNEVTNTWLVAQPDVIVASDGVPFLGDASHPRGAGTYARVLGHYARELGALTLMTGLKKMTIDPALRLEAFAPQARRKGRVQEGADADLTLFDPDEIVDLATYTLPARRSAGIVHVLVNGEFVVRDSEPVADVLPGRAVVSAVR